jgi:hypothetical protein
MTNESSSQDSAALDRHLWNLSHTVTITGLRPKDRHLAAITLDRLLLLPRFQTVEWLKQAELALALAQAKNRHFQLLCTQNEYHRHHQQMIQAMQ